MKVNIWHRVLPNIGATGAVHAEQVVDVLHKFNNENTIKAILVDNTNANTGCEGGMVAILEKKKFFNLHTSGSSLHYNELPFRALFKNIDGCAKGSTAFHGPLGKLCSKDCHDLPQISFSTISRPLDSILIIDEIVGGVCNLVISVDCSLNYSHHKYNTKTLQSRKRNGREHNEH